MSRIRLSATLLVLLATLAVGGCVDTPVAPELPTVESVTSLKGKPRNRLVRRSTSDDLTSLGDKTHWRDQLPIVTVIKRNTPLPASLEVRQRIGPEGGEIEIEEAGLKVAFPPGALSRTTIITVTAPAGDLVGYYFEPSGTQFNEPVVIKQFLHDTNAWGYRSLFGAYFQGQLEEQEEALEILPLVMSGSIAKFQIDHFSGYIIATN